MRNRQVFSVSFYCLVSLLSFTDFKTIKMSYNKRKERFDIQITTAGETVKKTFELDKHADILIGLSITSNSPDLLYFRGTQKIQINDQEIYPEGFESKLLMAGLNVAPDNRKNDLENMPTGNGRIEIYFTDVPDSRSRFEPYRVSFYFYSKSAE